MRSIPIAALSPATTDACGTGVDRRKVRTRAALAESIEPYNGDKMQARPLTPRESADQSAGFDEIAYGGLPDGRTTLPAGGLGTCKTIRAAFSVG